LYRYGGLYPGHTLTNWTSGLIAEKLESPTEVPLERLPRRATVYACRRTQSALVFDSTDARTKHMAAAFAVRCSIAIPLVFAPQWDEGMRVLDGGLRHNFPVEQLLADNPETEFIGLYLGPEIFEGNRGRTSLLSDVFAIWKEASDYEALERHRDNLVVIDTRPISMIDFELSRQEKDFLLAAGRASALKFLRKRHLL